MTGVSVIIPALNDSAMLQACLRALAAQTVPADEIIIVDNGSIDDTAAIARAGGARLLHEPRHGIFPATATGFDAARHELLARLEADSVPPPDWIERAVRAFELDSTLSALSGPGDFYGANPLVHWSAEHLYIGGYVWFIGLLLGHDPLFGSNLVLRAGAWKRLRLTVHRDVGDMHDDLDLSIHIEPDMVTRFDRTLRVGVSARPFDSRRALARRLRWAYTTIRRNWRERSLLDRRAARRAWRSVHDAD